MARYLAALVSCLLLIVGAVLLWPGKSDRAEALPMAPPPSSSSMLAQPLPEPPEATPKLREEKRFARADKDENGRITAAELFDPRRRRRKRKRAAAARRAAIPFPPATS